MLGFSRDPRTGLYLDDGILIPPRPLIPRSWKRRYWKRIEDRPEWWKWQAAIAPVTGQHGTAHVLVSSSTVTKAFPGNVTTGNCIVATVIWATVGGVTTTVTDNPGGGASNTYTARPVTTDSTLGTSQQDFVALNITGGSDTVTGNFSGPVASAVIFISEWSGVATSGAIDSGNSASEAYNNGTSAAPQSLNVTPSVNGCLVYGVADAVSGTPGAGTGYTLLDQDTLADISTIYQIQTTATTTHSLFTEGASTYWAATALILAPPSASFNFLDLAHDPQWQPLITH